nr:unnamed protein product [Salmonella enterica subsp. enterica serovar Gallinarum str. 287/91]
MPRPACHGTGAGVVVIVLHTLASLRAPFKPLSRHKLADDENCRLVIPRSALTRYRTRRTGSVRQGTVSR